MLFIVQASTSTESEWCSPTWDRADRTTQMHVAKAYLAEFSNKHTLQEGTEENTNP